MSVDVLDEVKLAPSEPEYVPPESEPPAPLRTRRGRGRPPKVKPAENTDDTQSEDKPSTNRKPRTPPVSSRRKLADDLLEATVEVASDMSAFAPTVSGVLIARAEVAVDGLMSLAKGHPRVEAALHKVTQVSKVAELMSLGALLIVAAGVDSGRIPTDSPLLTHLGYAEIMRDETGKPQRDDAGRIIKTRRTLKDIRVTMVGEEPSTTEPDIPPWEGQFPVTTGTAPAMFPPMNWIGNDATS